MAESTAEECSVEFDTGVGEIDVGSDRVAADRDEHRVELIRHVGLRLSVGPGHL